MNERILGIRYQRIAQADDAGIFHRAQPLGYVYARRQRPEQLAGKRCAHDGGSLHDGPQVSRQPVEARQHGRLHRVGQRVLN